MLNDPHLPANNVGANLKRSPEAEGSSLLASVSLINKFKVTF